MTGCLRPGCTGSTKTKYCSPGCAMLHRRAMGFRPHVSRVKASAAGKVGGRHSGQARRRACRQQLIALIVGHLAPLQGALSRRAWLRLLATALKMNRLGYQRGASARGQARWRQKQAERRKVA